MKITPDHLERGAFIYIRQSTPDQLANDHESRRRQYGLAERARTLGWTDVTVIDDDLGRSGSGVSRPGEPSRSWGSGCNGGWRVRAVGGLEALPEADTERAVVDGAADLEQQIGPAPGPAHLLRLGHAPVDQEIGRALGQ